MIVLEARDRVGGRVWTERETFSAPVDFGASIVTGTEPNPKARTGMPWLGIRADPKDGALTVMCLTRSAVETEKMDLARGIQRIFETAGCTVELSGDYPGWAPNPKSNILTTMSGLYRNLFQDEPKIQACHAGLECGILGTN